MSELSLPVDATFFFYSVLFGGKSSKCRFENVDASIVCEKVTAVLGETGNYLHQNIHN